MPSRARKAIEEGETALDMRPGNSIKSGGNGGRQQANRGSKKTPNQSSGGNAGGTRSTNPSGKTHNNTTYNHVYNHKPDQAFSRPGHWQFAKKDQHSSRVGGVGAGLNRATYDTHTASAINDLIKLEKTRSSIKPEAVLGGNYAAGGSGTAKKLNGGTNAFGILDSFNTSSPDSQKGGAEAASTTGAAPNVKVLRRQQKRQAEKQKREQLPFDKQRLHDLLESCDPSKAVEHAAGHRWKALPSDSAPGASGAATVEFPPSVVAMQHLQKSLFSAFLVTKEKVAEKLYGTKGQTSEWTAGVKEQTSEAAEAVPMSRTSSLGSAGTGSTKASKKPPSKKQAKANRPNNDAAAAAALTKGASNTAATLLELEGQCSEDDLQDASDDAEIFYSDAESGDHPTPNSSKATPAKPAAAAQLPGGEDLFSPTALFSPELTAAEEGVPSLPKTAEEPGQPESETPEAAEGFCDQEFNFDSCDQEFNFASCDQDQLLDPDQHDPDQHAPLESIEVQPVDEDPQDPQVEYNQYLTTFRDPCLFYDEYAGEQVCFATSTSTPKVGEQSMVYFPPPVDASTLVHAGCTASPAATETVESEYAPSSGAAGFRKPSSSRESGSTANTKTSSQNNMCGASQQGHHQENNHTQTARMARTTSNGSSSGATGYRNGGTPAAAPQTGTHTNSHHAMEPGLPRAPPAARVSQAARLFPRNRNNDWSQITTSSGHVPDFAAISSNVDSISKLMQSLVEEETHANTAATARREKQQKQKSKGRGGCSTTTTTTTTSEAGTTSTTAGRSNKGKTTSSTATASDEDERSDCSSAGGDRETATGTAATRSSSKATTKSAGSADFSSLIGGVTSAYLRKNGTKPPSRPPTTFPVAFGGRGKGNFRENRQHYRGGAGAQGWHGSLGSQGYGQRGAASLSTMHGHGPSSRGGSHRNLQASGNRSTTAGTSSIAENNSRMTMSSSNNWHQHHLQMVRAGAAPGTPGTAHQMVYQAQHQLAGGADPYLLSQHRSHPAENIEDVENKNQPEVHASTTREEVVEPAAWEWADHPWSPEGGPGAGGAAAEGVVTQDEDQEGAESWIVGGYAGYPAYAGYPVFSGSAEVPPPNVFPHHQPGVVWMYAPVVPPSSMMGAGVYPGSRGDERFWGAAPSSWFWEEQELTVAGVADSGAEQEEAEGSEKQKEETAESFFYAVQREAREKRDANLLDDVE
eukprot:CAMPEP_0178990020 /NCGR_PEP_ID=MMETSP0795-20121207/4698_1 /TAXON_ID=88552 /ORGANISM="Amoebophrya sp., Strain Ameob2" /LENGTH=1201 /DNA_ID=CAMNT_0020681487 /DNA_START=234 /DNA_END=3839 /DNA_ORIENTATION=+